MGNFIVRVQITCDIHLDHLDRSYGFIFLYGIVDILRSRMDVHNLWKKSMSTMCFRMSDLVKYGQKLN